MNCTFKTEILGLKLKQTLIYTTLIRGFILFSYLSQDVNTYTVKLDFKNHQDKNQLGFKNQITNDQPDQISFKNCQDKNNLTLRTKIAVTKNVLKVKFDCTF